MDKQMILSISREYGSGGHEIAERLSSIFEIPLYDSNLMKEVLVKNNIPESQYGKYDEVPKNSLLTRTMLGFGNSAEEYVANLEFDYLKEKADKKESFVVVGRCADSVLKKYDCMLSVFVRGEMASKIERIRTLKEVTAKEAEDMIKYKDKMRKIYHNYFCQEKWGDSRNYDLCINSSLLGVEGTVAVIEKFVRQSQMED